MSAHAASAIIDALRTPPPESDEAWGDRFRRQMAVVNAAEHTNAAGERELRVGPELGRVARELHEGMVGKRLSFGERRLYHALKSAIVGELATALGISETEATRRYDEAVAAR